MALRSRAEIPVIGGTSAAGSADLMLYSGSLETTELVQQVSHF